MTESILQKIRRSLPSMPASHQSVAGFILENYEEAAFLTSISLAKQCGVSESTVIRFIQSLGFSKYTMFQAGLQGLLRGRLSQVERFEDSIPPQEGDISPMGTLAHIMQADCQGIEKTLSGLHEQELKGAVKALSEAGNLFIIGSRSAYGLAYYFGSSLSWIRENVHVVDGMQGYVFDSLARMGEGDAALAISLPPYPVNTVKLLSLARGRGAATIAVTDSHLSPLAHEADYCLPVTSSLTTFADNAAPVMSLLTALTALVGAQNPEHTAQSLKQLEELWEECGVYLKKDTL